MVRRRQTRQPADKSPITHATTTAAADMDISTRNLNSRTQWILYAIASGACAAFNGVFAKLSVPPFTGTACSLAHSVHADIWESKKDYD